MNDTSSQIHCNWAGNLVYSSQHIHVPQTVEQIQEIVAQSKRIKPLGSRHSFNDIADTDGEIVSLQNLNRIVSLDLANQTVTIEGGVRYGDLCGWLHQQGWAIHNLASLPHISVVGACATATHGSGEQNGNLATAVCGLELVTADGALQTLSQEQNGEEFFGAVVGLGGLGVVTKLTLKLVPTFQSCQYVYRDLPITALTSHFDALQTMAYSVSLFTDWSSDKINQVWLKYRIPAESSIQEPPLMLWGAKLATENLHPLAEMSAENCTPQMGSVGAWYERLPHFRMEFTPSAGEELQSEYLLPRRFALDAIQAVNEMRGEIAPLLYVTEIRTIAADTLWMSPCYNEPCVAIHFTWRQNWEGVSTLLPKLEAQLEPFEARPHWGKLFAMPAARLQSLFVKMADFRELRHKYDPQGKFLNRFLSQNILNKN